VIIVTEFQAASPQPPASDTAGARGSRSAWLLMRELWPSLAISVMWVAVLLVSLFGPSIETSNGAGTNTSSVPSGVAVGLFAFLASWAVARYAFRRNAGQ
jgi:hypothetical protein